MGLTNFRVSPLGKIAIALERVMGIEPTLSAWKAEVLPLNYTRCLNLVEGAGFEPAKAEPSDLQSDPFDRSGTPPKTVSHKKYADATCK